MTSPGASGAESARPTATATPSSTAKPPSSTAPRPAPSPVNSYGTGRNCRHDVTTSDGTPKPGGGRWGGRLAASVFDPVPTTETLPGAQIKRGLDPCPAGVPAGWRLRLQAQP